MSVCACLAILVSFDVEHNDLQSKKGYRVWTTKTAAEVHSQSQIVTTVYERFPSLKTVELLRIF